MPGIATTAATLPIRFEALGRTWSGELFDTPSGREVARHLPLELQLRRWRGAWAGRRERALPIWLDPEPGRAPQAGELAWWPADSSLCLYLPPSAEEDPGRPSLPPEVNRIGRLTGDLAVLCRAGHQLAVRIVALGPAPEPSRGHGPEPAGAPLAATRVASDLHVGPAPDKRGLARLARQGFRALLDLREEGEPGQTLSPNVLGSWARAEALSHLRAPISRAVLQPASVDRLRLQLAAAPRPVYVFSGTGRRAVALLAIHLALEEGLSAADALARLRALGLDPGAHALTRFVETEVARRRPPE